MTQITAESPAGHDHEIIRSMMSSKEWQDQLGQAREQRAKVLAERDRQRQLAGSLTPVPPHEPIGQLPRSVHTRTRSLVPTPARDRQRGPRVERAASQSVSTCILAGVLFGSMIGLYLPPTALGTMRDMLYDWSPIRASQSAAFASSGLLMDSEGLTPALIDALKELEPALTIATPAPTARSYGNQKFTFPLGATLAASPSRTDDKALPNASKADVSRDHLSPARALHVSSLLPADNGAPRVSTLVAQVRLVATPPREQLRLRGGALSRLTNTINVPRSVPALAPIGAHDRAPQPSVFNYIEAADTYRVHLNLTKGARVQTAQAEVRQPGFAIGPRQPASLSGSETVVDFYRAVRRLTAHDMAMHRASGTIDLVGVESLSAWKNAILSTPLIACVTSASAKTWMGSCELLRIESSNDCAGKSAGNCGKVRVAPRVTTAAGVLATIDKPQDVLGQAELLTPTEPDVDIAVPSQVQEPAANEPSSQPPASENLGFGGANADSDQDNGLGSDVGGMDPSNPGQGNEQGRTDMPNGGNGSANDAGGVDDSNPSQGDKQDGSDKPGGGKNGHGNDADGSDTGDQGDGGGGEAEQGDDGGNDQGNDADGSDTGDKGDGGDNGGSDKD